MYSNRHFVWKVIYGVNWSETGILISSFIANYHYYQDTPSCLVFNEDICIRSSWSSLARMFLSKGFKMMLSNLIIHILGLLCLSIRSKHSVIINWQLSSRIGASVKPHNSIDGVTLQVFSDGACAILSGIVLRVLIFCKIKKQALHRRFDFVWVPEGLALSIIYFIRSC